jgi:hypothetical protein
MVGGQRRADLRDSMEIHPASSWGGTAFGENRAPTPVITVYTHRYLAEGIVNVVFILSLGLWGKP